MQAGARGARAGNAGLCGHRAERPAATRRARRAAIESWRSPPRPEIARTGGVVPALSPRKTHSGARARAPRPRAARPTHALRWARPDLGGFSRARARFSRARARDAEGEDEPRETRRRRRGRGVRRGPRARGREPGARESSLQLSRGQAPLREDRVSRRDDAGDGLSVRARRARASLPAGVSRRARGLERACGYCGAGALARVITREPCLKGARGVSWSRSESWPSCCWTSVPRPRWFGAASALQGCGGRPLFTCVRVRVSAALAGVFRPGRRARRHPHHGARDATPARRAVKNASGGVAYWAVPHDGVDVAATRRWTHIPTRRADFGGPRGVGWGVSGCAGLPGGAPRASIWAALVAQGAARGTKGR